MYYLRFENVFYQVVFYCIIYSIVWNKYRKDIVDEYRHTKKLDPFEYDVNEMMVAYYKITSHVYSCHLPFPKSIVSKYTATIKLHGLLSFHSCHARLVFLYTFVHLQHVLRICIAQLNKCYDKTSIQPHFIL